MGATSCLSGKTQSGREITQCTSKRGNSHFVVSCEAIFLQSLFFGKTSDSCAANELNLLDIPTRCSSYSCSGFLRDSLDCGLTHPTPPKNGVSSSSRRLCTYIARGVIGFYLIQTCSRERSRGGVGERLVFLYWYTRSGEGISRHTQIRKETDLRIVFTYPGEK